MKNIRHSLLYPYFVIRNSWPVWFGILNRRARLLFASQPPVLNDVAKRIVTDVKRDGIAFATLEELFPGERMLEKLQNYMKEGDKLGHHLRKKTFLLPYWDEQAPIGMDNPFFAMSLRPEVLNIVNSYDGMWRKLNFLQLTETIPVGSEAPRQSQRWHRDPQEKRQMKYFVYLSDVDEEAGPFTYAKRSQFGSPVYGNLFKQKLPLGVYPPEGAVEKAVDSKDIVSAMGRAGTVIFCDTAGLHRGGYAKSKSRFMFTAFYPSMKWTEHRQHSLNQTVDLKSLSPASAFAAEA